MEANPWDSPSKELPQLPNNNIDAHTANSPIVVVNSDEDDKEFLVRLDSS